MPSDASPAGEQASILTTDAIRPDPHGPFPVAIPFIRALGIHLTAFGDGRAELRLDLEDWHLNSFSMAHGGAIMTMLDIGLAMAGRASPRDDDDDTKGLVTIELKTTFMQPAYGKVLRALAQCTHRTASLAFCEGEIRDENDKVVAKASGTFKYMKQRRA